MAEIIVTDLQAQGLAESFTESIVEALERKYMPEGTSFSEEQWERLSEEIFGGLHLDLRFLRIDTEDIDK